jgi:hypothetical protein
VAPTDTLAPDAGEELPELATVSWRRRVDARELRRSGRAWTLTSFAHAVPMTAAAIALPLFKPVLGVVSLVLLAHAWAIPELWANKGAGVLRPRPRAGADAEQTALLLLGDLLDTRARELHARTGLALQRGQLGAWLVGEAGAILVRPGGRRAFCYCVRVAGEPSAGGAAAGGSAEADLPASDRVSHLLLALRADESGFATVANLAFSGSPWRVRRRMLAAQRPALDEARVVAREGSRGSC